MTDVVALLERLIRVDTHNPGGSEQALATLLSEELAAHRPDELKLVPVPRDSGRPGEGAYLIARWGTPRLLINAHLDTVPPNRGWSQDPFTPAVAHGRIYGLGACDTKGAIAAVLAALDNVAPRDLALVFSGDEEFGGSCMRAIIERERGPQRPLASVERAIVCEPTSCRAGTRHRGVLGLEAYLSGKGGHSSLADELPAPVADLARLAVEWHEWGVRMREVGPLDFRGMCLNVAQLDGGVAFNVVPKEARLTVSVRPPPGSDVGTVRDELVAIAARVVPAAKLTAGPAAPAFATREPGAFSPALGVHAPVDLAFWTEAALLSQAGIDCVVYGPGDIARAHAADEFVPVADLVRARDAFAAILKQPGEVAGNGTG
jgi:acetylornithine deacetylase